MNRHGYDRSFALGAIAGSSCLGMLIPPSVLMIVWGILTEKSIGALFLAGVIPGLMVAGMFCLYILGVAILRPEVVGAGRPSAAVAPAVAENPAPAVPSPVDALEAVDRFSLWTSTLGIVLVVVTVLGGIWLGFFTPTDGGGAGAFIGLHLRLVKGMRIREIIECILSVGRTSAPILILVGMGA